MAGSLRKSGNIPLLPIQAFVASTGANVNFTFFYLEGFECGLA